jgi:uncharacterized membrane protein (DUF106 family)
MDVWSDIFSSVVSFLQPVSTMPYSTLFVLGIGILLSLVSSLITVKMVDVGKMKAGTAELQAWRAKLNQARKTMDPVLLQEVMNEQSHIMQVQLSMQGARMKPCCIYYIPFLITFAILNGLYGATPVAILPFNPQSLLPFLEPSIGVTVPGGGFGLWFWSWYVLSGMSLNSIIQKAFGIPTV